MSRFIKQYLTVMLLLAAISLSGCATTVATSGRIALHDKNARTGTTFTDRDRQLIRRYYKSRRQGKRKFSPGLAQKGKLPNGLAKRDSLPAGRRLRGLPGDLEFHLTKLPKEYVRVIVGGDVVIMNRTTRVVIDIYRDVFVD